MQTWAEALELPVHSYQADALVAENTQYRI